jgi:hypothetical protein
MFPYLVCQLYHFIGHFRISFSVHIPDTFKVDVIFNEQFVHSDLFIRKPFDNLMVEGGTATILAYGKSALFGLDLEQLLLINGTSKLYKFLFHSSFFNPF